MQKTLVTLLLTLAMVTFSLSATADSSNGNRIVFLLQTDRSPETLKADAELIYQAVKSAKKNDFIEALELSGKQIMSLQMTKNNPLDARRDMNMAGGQIKNSFTNYINSRQSQKGNNLANALKCTFERLNAEKKRNRYIIVVLSSGLYRDGLTDFAKGYPSDSWVSHTASPFASIPKNNTGKKLELIFVTQPSDYINSYHAGRIERFYTILASRKNAELAGFTDHNTALELIRNGSEMIKPVPQTDNSINDPLTIYRLDNKKTQPIEKSAPQKTSVNIRTAPSLLSGSILKLSIENGVALLWVSIRDPHGRTVQNIKPGNLQLCEDRQAKRNIIPSGRIKIQRDRHYMAVAFARDTSGSINSSAMEDANNAIRQFSEQMMPDDLAALIDFGSKASIACDFTKGSDFSAKPLRKLRLGNSTALYDGILLAISQLEKQDRRCVKAVIAFTDGKDTNSGASPQEALNAAKSSSIPIFLVGVGSVDEDTLRAIAEGSNGMYFPASDTTKLQGIYCNIAGILSRSVLISYTSTAKSGDEVQVDLSVAYNLGSENFQGQFCSDRVRVH